MFESPLRLALGLVTGIVFGFLLQKGRVARHEVIVGQLVLRDFTVVKIMLTAVAVGAAGFWALVALGLTPVDVKPAQLGGVLAGAALFGVGLAVLGYCPGTTVAALGEGRKDAIAGALGMLAGAAVFVSGFSFFGPVQRSVADWGKTTLPTWTSLQPVVWVAALLGAAAVTRALARPRRRTSNA
jgi:uncharacterized membrane protein YedE/YeeE